MKSLSLLLMLGSMAWGQTRPSPPQDFQVYTVDTGAPHVTFSGTPPTQQPETQPFGEGWSAECVTVNSFLHLITPNYDRADCWPDRKEIDGSGNVMVNGKNVPPTCETDKNGVMIDCHEQEHPEETVDVPAIHERASSTIANTANCNAQTAICIDGPMTCTNGGTLVPDGPWKTCVGGFVLTCEDKTRILMHDEQDPPKYWCHAPIR
jgi:hypothetical protein